MKTIIQLDAFESEYDKNIIVKPSVRRGLPSLRNKLRALYKEVGDYNYAQQYIAAKNESEKLIKKRWGKEVEKKILLSMFYTAVDEFSQFGNSIEEWLLRIHKRGY